MIALWISKFNRVILLNIYDLILIFATRKHVLGSSHLVFYNKIQIDRINSFIYAYVVDGNQSFENIKIKGCKRDHAREYKKISGSDIQGS